MKERAVIIIDDHDLSIPEVNTWIHYFQKHIDRCLDYYGSPDYDQIFIDNPRLKKRDYNYKFKTEIKMFTNLVNELKSYVKAKPY